MALVPVPGYFGTPRIDWNARKQSLEARIKAGVQGWILGILSKPIVEDGNGGPPSPPGFGYFPVSTKQRKKFFSFLEMIRSLTIQLHVDLNLYFHSEQEQISFVANTIEGKS